MVTFNFSYAPGTSVQQMTGFETAGRIWSSYLTDNVTINIHAGVSSDLGSNVIGGALPGIRASQSYESIRNQLEADATSADDQIAIKSLQGGKEYKARFDYFIPDDKIGRRKSLDEAKSEILNLTRAGTKAMGFSLADGATALDGIIAFGSLAGSTYSWNYDYSRSSVAPANSLDFLSTAIHEIGHVLGFVSGVDKPGWLDSTVVDKTAQTVYKNYLDTRVTYTTALDLFRYSDDTLGKSRNDLSYGSKGGAKYFSIDGKTAITQFSTGKDTSLGGDGNQASHWKSEGIMDPGLAPGARETLSMLDLQAMDVIGWNLASNAAALKLDLSALAGQSQQALAQRVGQTVTWLNANATTAAASLSQDRSQDIAKMVQDSQIYNWGTTWFNPYRQVVDLMGRQEVYSSFQTTTSMCSCTVCHQSAQTGLAAALSSPATTTTGWLGAGQPEGQSGLRTHDRNVHQRINQVVQAAIRNQAEGDSLSSPAAPNATLPIAQFVEFSRMPSADSAPRPWDQNPGDQTRRYDSGPTVRRFDDWFGRSDPSSSDQPSFDPLATLTLS